MLVSLGEAAQVPPNGAAGAGELMMMLLADARLPTGSHTQSAGLEPAINAGMTVGQIPQYIAARQSTVVAVEAAAALLARHLCDRALRETARLAHLADRLAEVDAAWRARTISAAQRETSVLLGRGYARLVTRLWPASPIAAALAVIRGSSRAVVLGAAAAMGGVGAAQLARIIGYDDAQTIAAAALKITPLDPVDATRWVLAASGDIEDMVRRVADIVDLDQIPAEAAPQTESWAEIHRTTRARLFRA